jgi:hypothetical protein
MIDGEHFQKRVDSLFEEVEDSEELFQDLESISEEIMEELGKDISMINTLVVAMALSKLFVNAVGNLITSSKTVEESNVYTGVIEQHMEHVNEVYMLAMYKYGQDFGEQIKTLLEEKGINPDNIFRKEP